jgi:hypothetical protein
MKSLKPRKKIPAAWQRSQQLWSRIRPDKCHDVQRTTQLMVDSIVSCSIPGPHSSRDSIEQITRNASLPINVESLSEALAKPILPRGAVYFGRLGDVLDEIAVNYPDMYWWVSENGLNMAIMDPNHILPDPFDELAGSLTIQHWKNGRLSTKNLLEIAAELDKNQFPLNGNLQPNEWFTIAEHNQKSSRTPIKTFLEAAKHRRFGRLVRRCLYRARHKKMQAKSARTTARDSDFYA